MVNIMSTLRNKLLVKDLQRSANDTDVKILSTRDYHRICKTLYSLTECNRRLSNCLKNVSQHYEQKYEMRLERLRKLLCKKTRKLKILQKKFNLRKHYIIIVRHGDEFLFYSHVSQIEADTFSVVVYRISKNPGVDKEVSMSIARTKYAKKSILNENTVHFQETHDADNFESDLKKMFNV
ncbi:ORF-123 [Buzura suppressaria nucleopolyhedrovirus]|uniref:ORF-123 n=1 Tax=Buzura suppressaria nuclear polyhedrosis virus TaxID=74320 RepID=W5VSF9_NPVBS|nr:ORF-123 [Buzura suppressaria nucleopolyhedrovirus]AHH82712.1 ORF-123 [Buzura suppressaria nucleopolyhedrovirus]AKN91096.1 ORF-126 [Buzura suppressaria nucleopolyhedrovirus]